MLKNLNYVSFCLIKVSHTISESADKSIFNGHGDMVQLTGVLWSSIMIIWWFLCKLWTYWLWKLGWWRGPWLSNFDMIWYDLFVVNPCFDLLIGGAGLKNVVDSGNLPRLACSVRCLSVQVIPGGHCVTLTFWKSTEARESHAQIWNLYKISDLQMCLLLLLILNLSSDNNRKFDAVVGRSLRSK